MSSSSATSSDPLAGVVVGDYRPEDSPEAIELERACSQPQGSGLRLSFRREVFHARAGLFASHRLFTARLAGRLVGVVAAAVKSAVLLGRPCRAGFGFDLRVHPDLRGRGLGARLLGIAHSWAAEGADFTYTYTSGNNPTAARLALRAGPEAGGFAYLVYPAYRRLPVVAPPVAATAEEVHAEMLGRAGPFGLHFDPFDAGPLRGLAGSWLLRAGGAVAGCSAWSGRGVLAEVVEQMPWGLRLARGALRYLAPARRAWPRIPDEGEELRSWYLFDAFAGSVEAGRHLLRAVAAEARERGVDYCYLIHGGGEAWVEAARRDVPRPFAPLVPYRLFVSAPGRPASRIGRLCVDVRDL